MDALRKLVLATATMSESQLRDARRLAEEMTDDGDARQLVINLIDIFTAIGEDTDRRAQLAAACLMAIEEGERQSSRSSSTARSLGKGRGAGWLVACGVAIALGAGVYAVLPHRQAPPQAAAPAERLAPQPQPRRPQGDLAPKPGEIALGGTVKAWQGRTQLTATVTSFALPGAPWRPTRAPRPRVLVVTGQTRLLTTGGGASRSPQALLKPGARISAVGPDSGAGKPLTARAISAE